MEQGEKKKPNDNPSIMFNVPQKTTDKVDVGAEYIAEKWIADSNLPNGGKWVEVGRKTLTQEEKDKRPNDDFEKYPMFTIPLEQNAENENAENKVSNGDIIRIVSYEKNSKAVYNKEPEKTEKAYRDGFSKPAYSTGDKNKAPGEDGGNKEYVVLDLVGPTATVTAKEDEAFRRYLDITAQLEGGPKGPVFIEFGEVQGAEGNEKKEFKSAQEALKYIKQIPWNENMPKMWVVSKDVYGNESSKEIDYKQSYQCSVAVVGERAGRPFIAVSADKEGVKVVIKVYHDDVLVAEGSVTTGQVGAISRLDFKKVVNGAASQEAYKLQVDDVLEISGSVEIDNKLYTTNPFSIEIED